MIYKTELNNNNINNEESEQPASMKKYIKR